MLNLLVIEGMDGDATEIVRALIKYAGKREGYNQWIMDACNKLGIIRTNKVGEVGPMERSTINCHRREMRLAEEKKETVKVEKKEVPIEAPLPQEKDFPESRVAPGTLVYAYYPGFFMDAIDAVKKMLDSLIDYQNIDATFSAAKFIRMRKYLDDYPNQGMSASNIFEVEQAYIKYCMPKTYSHEVQHSRSSTPSL